MMNVIYSLLLCILLATTVFVAPNEVYTQYTTQFSNTNQYEDSSNNNNNRNIDNNQQAKCGYSSCPKTQPNKINIHLVPHTHDDVGWLKTVDQYYYGTKKGYSPVAVENIIDSVIPQLLMDKNRRFIYVEMSFFSKWWRDQDDKMKQTVRGLVESGQLEFINGGWCMNDEATTTYQSIIDQMTVGLKFLEENFGQCGRPKVGWQIDPFGHSNEQASLFAQFGFDGMFFQRIDYLDKWSRALTKSLDLIWHGDEAYAGDTGSIYTNVFLDGYSAPSTFCYDVYCNDRNLVDDKRTYEYNIEERISSFAAYIKYYAEHKRTNQIMIPMGGDFQYTSAHQNFHNLDKLIKNLNMMRPEMNAFYSTPSCYQYSLNEAGKLQNITWPQKLDDFFPYGSESHAYWTGYFTSRPSVKLFERKSSTFLQISRQMALSLMINNLADAKTIEQSIIDGRWNSELESHESQCLERMWQLMGDLQHHDAITGTEKQHVADDYIRRGMDAIEGCIKTLSLTKRINSYDLNQIGKSESQLELDNLWCPSLNISHCWAIEHYLRPSSEGSAGVRVTLFNPLAEKLDQLPIRLPCPAPCDISKLSVRETASGNITAITKVPLNAGLDKLKFRVSLADEEMQFYASLPPVGYSSYEISFHEQFDSINTIENHGDITSSRSKAPDRLEHIYNGERWIRTSTDHNRFDLGISQSQYENDVITKIPLGDVNELGHSKRYLNINLKTGQLEGITFTDDYQQFKQKFGFYYPSPLYRSSGAYIMRPNSTSPHLLQQPEKFKIFKSDYVIEIHQKWNEWIWQTVRADAYVDYIEYDYVVGPLPKKEREKIGIEVISRYETTLTTDGVFYTDSNGRQLIARRRVDASFTTEPVAANYYPVTTTMLLKGINHGKSVDFAILTDRAQGGTSLDDGQLEFLIHRRSLLDDDFGVDEALNEPGEDGRGLTIRGQHRVLIKFSPKPNGYRLRVKKRDDDPIGRIRKRQLLVDGNFNTENLIRNSETSLIMDSNFDEIRHQSIRFLLRPFMTFEPIKQNILYNIGDQDESRITIDGSKESKVSHSSSLLNMSLPTMVHLLTIQPWKDSQILLRLENLQNPLTIHRSLYSKDSYEKLIGLYKDNQADKGTASINRVGIESGEENQIKEVHRCRRLRSHYQRSKYNGRYYTHRLACANYLNDERNSTSSSNQRPSEDRCSDSLKPNYATGDIKLDVEYLIKNVRIVNLQEMGLGANEKLDQISRLNWNTKSDSDKDSCNTFNNFVSHDNNEGRVTNVILGPRQIKTFLATFEKIQ